MKLPEDHFLRRWLPPEAIELIERPWFPVALWADCAATALLVGVVFRAAGMPGAANVFLAAGTVFVILAARALLGMRR